MRVQLSTVTDGTIVPRVHFGRATLDTPTLINTLAFLPLLIVC